LASSQGWVDDKPCFVTIAAGGLEGSRTNATCCRWYRGRPSRSWRKFSWHWRLAMKSSDYGQTNSVTTV
jgi:hypothetical protein